MKNRLSLKHKQKIAKSVEKHWKQIKDSLAYIERCENMSNSKKGKPSPFKGKKRPELLGNKNSKGRIPWNKGKERPEMKGEKNPNWKGGTTFDIYHRVRTKEWKQLVKLILKRDNHTCQNCGVNENLHVHHIIPYRIIQDDNPKNLITLCRRCHALFDNKIRREEKKNGLC